MKKVFGVNRMVIVASKGNNIKGAAAATGVKVNLSSTKGGILMVSASLKLQGLSIILKLRGHVICGLISIVRDGYHLGRTIVGSAQFRGLCLLPSTRAGSGADMSPRRVGGLVSRLGSSCSFVLLSYPTKVRRNFGGTVTNTRHSVIIAAPRISSVHSTSEVVKLLRTSNVQGGRLLVGHLHISVIHENSVVSMRSIARVLTVSLLKIVPSSRSIIITAGRKRPMINRSSLTKGYCRGVYEHLLKRRIPVSSFGRGPKLHDGLSDLFRGG